MRKFALLILLILMVQSNVNSATTLEQKLELFHSDPATFLNTLPEAQNADRRFNHREILEKIYVEAKSSVRDQIILNSDPAGVGYNDQVETLFPGEALLETLQEMDELKLQEGEVKVLPWSDDYWPIYQGITGKRYGDQYFAYKENWEEHYKYVLDSPSMKVFKEGVAADIDILSPSEKYDLLFGREVNLTSRMWSEGKEYWDRYGDVETWMGICHGWAPASFMLDRPSSMITVKAYDGKTDLNFYPSDIKALSSLLWANVRVPTYFVGGRCNTKNPETDDQGRITDQECFDTNPATWHRAIVEQIGKRGQSFVFDATYDYQVWNQPAVSYSYTYFNPQTLKEEVSLKEGITKIERFERDVFKKYRSSKAKYVVGVQMDVVYLVETEPSQQVSDSAREDQHRSVSYMYDLELDKDYKIIGGEWYQNYHPDFIWLPRRGSRAMSSGDYAIGENEIWSEGQSVPKSWAKPAKSSAQKGQPLAKIVEKLIEKSRQN